MSGGCLSFDLLERLVFDGSIGGPEGAAVDAHLRNCSGCRTRLAEMRQADRFIAELSLLTSHDTGAERGEASSSIAPRDDFPGYAVEAIVDIGGQGAVYRGRQLATGRVVAIKVPLGDAVRHPARRYRFRREIELTSRLDHPGIIRVFGVCEAPDGRIGCVMEFVVGQRFDEWAAARRGQDSGKGRDGVRQIVTAAASIADAIAYAHQRGVLHRDLKPSNVLVTADGLPRVLDFGLAKALDGGSGSFVTMTGAFLGTLAYAAPEQVGGKGDDTDVRTDVYGIALVLYQALAGRLPWDADAAPSELLAAIRRGDIAPPTAVAGIGGIAGGADAALDAIVLKGLATEKERRYPSVALLAEDLERWLTGRPVRARFDSRWYVLRKSAWRQRWWIAAATVLFGVLGSLTAMAISRHSAETRAAIAGAARDARALESHWAVLADARAVARDEFSFGEQRVWEALLGAEGALVQAGVEGAPALAQRLDDSPEASRDWSTDVPTSPAYWALWEIYLRTPVLASLPELIDGSVIFEPHSERLLVARGRALERWEWRRGRMHDRIELPLAEVDTAKAIVASGTRAVVTSIAGALAVVDLESTKVARLPVLIRGNPQLVGSRLLFSTDDEAGPDTRRVLELWSLDGPTPQMLWSREFPFRCEEYVIDAGGQFVAASSLAGDLVALDAATGATLLRRTPDDTPRFRRLGSRGRVGEAISWGAGGFATLEWADGSVSLHGQPPRHVGDVGLHGDYIKHLPPAPNGTIGSRFAVGLDRGGVAIGRTDRPIEDFDPIPTIRCTNTPFLSFDERRLLFRVGEGQRWGFLDLEPAGITRLPHPAPVRIGGAATVFAVGFDDAGTCLLTTAMDGSLRRYSVPPSLASTENACNRDAGPVSPAGSVFPSVDSTVTVQCASAAGVTCFAKDGATTYLGTHDHGRRDAKLMRLCGSDLETLLDDGRTWYCGLALEPGAALWALGGDGRIFRMNLVSGAIEAERKLAPSPKNAGHHTVARLAQRGIILAGPGGHGVHVLNEETLEPACESVEIPPMRQIVVSPTDPDLFVTTHDSGVIRVWRVRGGVMPTAQRPTPSTRGAESPLRVELLRELGAHGGPVFCAAFHPSGRILATGGGSPESLELRLWDLDAGRELAALSLFENGVFTVAFSPDGRWLAAGGEPAPGKYAEGGLLYLIDLAAAERCIAGNLEYHIARWTHGHDGQPPPQAGVLRARLGLDG